ncbi:cation diffusion facilitator CzcD-associated flavoprotein CzcO [Salinibacterium sp. CAN_S4]|uniref:flavin-containing monooxygenase n=1 Tax=Salinibacterium sp. CAN_S4 TaxID=2787727 RepID=UPI0018EFC4A8
MSAIPPSVDALVIGAGPAGLATAAELTPQGLAVLVIDKADRVGSSWSRHYDRLHLHTARRLSSLPGTPIPSTMGQWVARDDFLRYLSDYTETHALDVRLGVTALSVTRDGDGWLASTDRGTIHATVVVVATGYNHTPFRPEWDGVDSFHGQIIHSSEYRNPDQVTGSTVLVVGTGNSGAEIAADLAEGGHTVLLSVRTMPNIVPRAVVGIPNQLLVLSISPLPRRARDIISGALQKIVIGDLSRYGITRAPRGIVTQLERDDVVPTIDVGLIRALKAGTVMVVASIDRFEDGAVRLSDGSTIAPDAIVVATGYRRGLESLVGGLDILLGNGRPKVNADAQLDNAPGLYFIGYSNPITGNIRQLAIDARRIARVVKQRS